MSSCIVRCPILLAASLALAACAASAPAPDEPVTTAAAPLELAPAVAPLFERDRTWTYTLQIERSFWDDTHPDADPQGNVTESETAAASCSVDDVLDLGTARASSISCDADLPVGGTWLANAEGLYAVGAMPTSAAELDAVLADATLVLPAPPVETEKTEEFEEGFGHTWRVSPAGEGWCVEFASWGGDEAGTSLCLDPDLGPTGGATWWAGGSSHETTFELLP